MGVPLEAYLVYLIFTDLDHGPDIGSVLSNPRHACVMPLKFYFTRNRCGSRQ